MEIKDVSYLAILEDNKNVLYDMNFDRIDTDALLSTITRDVDPISIYKDRSLFIDKNDNIFVILLARPESNDIFVHNAFMNLIEVLKKIIKEWRSERVGEKYDQIVLSMNEFVFNGIILTDKHTELNNRIMKRSFENITGLKVNKGFASFLHKATKSLRNN